MRNTWLATNGDNLAGMKLFLTECEYKPEFDKFPIRKIQLLLNGLEAEVNRLQNENVLFKKQSDVKKQTDVKKQDDAKKE